MSKLKLFSMAALAALTLAACSKSNEGSQIPDENPGPGEKTYASFSVTVTSANTRAFHGELAPTTSEKAVDRLTVYIYDISTDTVEEVLTFTDENDSHTVEITTGPKKFLATSGMAPAYAKGDTNIVLDKVIDITDETDFAAKLTTASKFAMTSDIVTHTVVSASETEAETPGHHNYIIMRLGRAMAKIGVYAESQSVIDDSDTALGTFADAKYKIKNQPNKMYIFTDYDASGVWRTPYFDRNNSIWDDSHAADYWHQGTYHSAALNAGNHSEPTYMMENSNMNARYGNSTYAAITGSFVPDKWFDANGDDATASNPPTAGSDFWRVADAVEYEADGTTVKKVLSWKNDNKLYREEPNSTVLGTGEVAIKYTNGEMFYWIYLDSSLGQSTPVNTADKFSQHRNQYWDVEITKITGLGWHEEDGGKSPDPEPIDKDTHIHATIQVLNWVGVSMPGELEGK